MRFTVLDIRRSHKWLDITISDLDAKEELSGRLFQKDIPLTTAAKAYVADVRVQDHPVYGRQIKSIKDIRPPRYLHDCESCEFLGWHKEYDLYYCPTGSYVARYSSDGPGYTSSTQPHSNPALLEAVRLNDAKSTDY